MRSNIMKVNNLLETKQVVEDILRSIRFKIFWLQAKEAHSLLAEKKGFQQDIYDNLKEQFFEKYKTIKKYERSQMTTLVWRDYNKKLEEALLPYPPFSFLHEPLIMMNMFVSAGGKRLKYQVDFLEKTFPVGELKRVLLEDYIGKPLILSAKYLSSHNSIHHLSHVARFLKTTKCDLDKINTIFEWGGGYGCMAKIISRLAQRPFTYILVDTPLLSCVQWLYLSVIFGEKNVNLLLGPKDNIKARKFNIISTGLIETQKIKTDLFISTWGLSESPKNFQDYITKKNWFGAKHMLIAFQKANRTLPHADRLGDLARKKGAIVEDVPFLRGSHYAFL